ncbi:MAG: tetratricopeptide repeat protein [Euryarchaeota archaeon]|nr:tetratricopeptide repeat protein [Euryarchaeota archaeon]
MEQKELIEKFLGLEDEDKTIVDAWKLFIATNKAYRDVDARIISRREGDNVRRKFMKHIRKNKLRMLGEEEGLKAHELAIIREGGVVAEGEIKTLNNFDVWLLTDFADVCTAWVAGDLQSGKGVPDEIIAFLEDPYVNERLKERLIEKDTGRGEGLLKAILEDKPSALIVHLLLMKHYENESRLAEAETECKRMLTETDDELVWANYGDLLEERGRYEEAFDAFKKGFEVCERVGRAEDGIGVAIKENISRVERMKNLEGDEAEKAREYWEAMRLLDKIREFADRTFVKETKDAQEEYKGEKGIEQIDFEDAFDFLNWFLFSRTLKDGRTPGIAYAEEKGLSEKLKEKIKGLGNPIKGDFEVVSVDQATFKFAVKDVKTEEEYELMGDVPDIKAGLTFAGNIYPWSEFYLTGGVLKAQEED